MTQCLINSINFSILLLSTLFLVAFKGYAQGLPTDPQVITGKLENGLTYYIRHNDTPKGQADFFIAQKVGSILEEENQLGLAHFLEHMCFNGTKHFPGHSMKEWLESIGVKYGENFNAYTAWDETVYNISNVPVSRNSVVDSCLLILHDWACDLLLEEDEIDAERAVIHQEWRMRNNASQRLYQKLLPKMMSESKYAYRFPIGTMEVVDNFPYEDLRAYYNAWYRPDQQAIIVVGDIDTGYILSKIKELFSPIQMPKDAPERYTVSIEDNKGTIFAIAEDPELTRETVALFFKSDPLEIELRNTPQYFVQQTLITLITSMVNNRLSDMASTPESPLLMASLSYGPFLITQTKEAFQLGVVPKNNDICKSLEGAYRELLRAARYGFTQEELDRAKEEIQSSYQMSYNNRNSRTNTQYAEEYVRNFTSGEPIPGIEVENKLVQLLLTQLPLEIVNGVVSEIVTTDNRVLMVMQPQRKGFKLPTENELAKVLSSVDQEDLKPYEEESTIDTLLPTLPAPGKIITETKNPLWDATEMTLSNGIKVIVKPTDFRQDEVQFMAIAPGGTSTLSDEMNSSLAFLPYLAGSITIGDYSTTDLRKYLSGKKVEFIFDFNAYYRTATGSSTVKDLPTLMELIYGYMTEANINQKDFESKQTLFSSALANADADPQQVFSKLMTQSFFQNTRKHYISQKAIDEATEDQIREIVRTMTYNPQDYTFAFVGNIDMEQFKPLLLQYIATLPEGNSNLKSPENSKNNLEDLEDNGLALKVTTNPTINPTLSITPGEHRSDFTMEMSTPQSTMAVIKTANMPTTEMNFYLSRIVGAILEQRLIETVREELGAVYSISAAGNMSTTLASPNVQITSIFPLKPECEEQVLEVFKKEFTNMENDIQEEELQKALEYLIKNNAEALEENSIWTNAMAYNTLSGIAPLINGQEVLKSITTQDLMNFLKEVNSQRNLQIVTLSPEN